MTLREQYLRENHGDPVEAAAILAVRLMRDDPATLKDGYDEANAVIAALEIFPEVDRDALRWRMFQIHDPA